MTVCPQPLPRMLSDRLGAVKVEGVVEFKSLPSGLHRVEEDLV